MSGVIVVCLVVLALGELVLALALLGAAGNVVRIERRLDALEADPTIRAHRSLR